jgi:hypothetical protein
VGETKRTQDYQALRIILGRGKKGKKEPVLGLISPEAGSSALEILFNNEPA